MRQCNRQTEASSVTCGSSGEEEPLQQSLSEIGQGSFSNGHMGKNVQLQCTVKPEDNRIPDVFP